MKMEFSAGGIVYRKIEGKIEFALILDSYGKWTFPKGHIEKGEKPEEAACREINEEIGLSDLKILLLLDKIDYWFKFENNLIHKYVYFYLMEATKESILKPDPKETKGARWLSKEDSLKFLDYKQESEMLLVKSINFLEKEGEFGQ